LLLSGRHFAAPCRWLARRRKWAPSELGVCYSSRVAFLERTAEASSHCSPAAREQVSIGSLRFAAGVSWHFRRAASDRLEAACACLCMGATLSAGAAGRLQLHVHVNNCQRPVSLNSAHPMHFMQITPSPSVHGPAEKRSTQQACSILFPLSPFRFPLPAELPS